MAQVDLTSGLILCRKPPVGSICRGLIVFGTMMQLFQYFRLRTAFLSLGYGRFFPHTQFMKIVASAFAIAALIFASSSCAKHDWEETKVLHEGSSHHGHGDAKHGEAQAHGDAKHAPAEAKH